MGYLVLLIICIILVCAFEEWNKRGRAVTGFSSVAEMLDVCVIPWTLCGWDGTRTVIYHQPSGLMVQVIKGLHPPLARDGKVNLRVAKTRTRNTTAYRMDKGWAVTLRSGHVCRSMPVRKLPSPYVAEVVEDVDCGASIIKTEEIVRRMLSEEHIPDNEEVLYAWCEKGKSSYIMGRFQE